MEYELWAGLGNWGYKSGEISHCWSQSNRQAYLPMPPDDSTTPTLKSTRVSTWYDGSGTISWSRTMKLGHPLIQNVQTWFSVKPSSLLSSTRLLTVRYLLRANSPSRQRTWSCEKAVRGRLRTWFTYSSLVTENRRTLNDCFVSDQMCQKKMVKWKSDSYFRLAVNTYVTISKVRNVGIVPL